MSGKKILLVDDDEEMLLLIKKKLIDEGYDPIVIHTGKEALSEVESIAPDLILMDIVLPDIDGAEVVKTIQERMLVKDVPIVFLSGIVAGDDGEDPTVTVNGIKYNAIAKPFTSKRLIEEVKRSLKI